ncbi:Os02g0824100 protein, related [Neospora caninum Liverpool]|uniref:Os02g0824100 protein, related n=1 Tax=Neospora caninum (strain Liverpool) TaxID=572307 RepID=F0VNX5_NEOCL|nr:Os02g0824100 protein, related [Neospora caninum Liverpool]CBZ55421.1 Os02g0824100 protein, related [Neospora caninum Liverpool]|eukprot:XP_003885449.1 Os02g0824100 protein, related [Neospora caninum Liverpool]
MSELTAGSDMFSAIPAGVQQVIRNVVFWGATDETAQKWRLRVLGVGAVAVAGAASWVYLIYPFLQHMKVRNLPQPGTSTWLNGDKKELEKHVKGGEKRRYFSRLRQTVGPNCFIRLPLQFSLASLTKNPFGLLFVTSDWNVIQELTTQSGSLDLVALNDTRAVDALQLTRLAMFDLWLNLLTGRQGHHALTASGHLALTPNRIETGALPYSTVEAIMTMTRFHKENYELLFLPTDSSAVTSTAAHKALVQQYKAVVNAAPVILTQMLDEKNQQALLPRILAAEDSVTRRGLAADEIRDSAALLFLASENTALPIVWALYELAKDQALQQRIHTATRVEDLTVIDSTDQLISRLGEVLNLFLEALRFYALPILSRSASSPIQLKSADLTIPAGTVVLVDNYSLTRDETLWGQDANVFNPDRFSGKIWQQAPWLPFGFGSRKCIGERVAVTHAVLFLAVVVRYFALELDTNSMPPEPVERQFLTPDKPVMLRFRPRV